MDDDRFDKLDIEPYKQPPAQAAPEPPKKAAAEAPLTATCAKCGFPRDSLNSFCVYCELLGSSQERSEGLFAPVSWSRRALPENRHSE